MTRFSRDSCVFRGINTDEIFKYLIQNRFILEEIVCGLKREKGNRFVVSLIEKKKKKQFLCLEFKIIQKQKGNSTTLIGARTREQPRD